MVVPCARRRWAADRFSSIRNRLMVGAVDRRYTCYGCHEHTPNNIHRKHTEGGIRIRNYDNCIRCHINADELVSKGKDTRKGGRKEKSD